MARRSRLPRLTEAEFQKQVTGLADLNGWEWNHIRRTPAGAQTTKWVTATSKKGYPDLEFWHPIRHDYFKAELKKENGLVSPAQKTCILSMRDAGLEVHVWRPSMWPVIQARLEQKPDRSLLGAANVVDINRPQQPTNDYPTGA